MYDYLIIGGGPAGLYCAKRIEEESPIKNLRILLLEKESVLGGRTRVETFHSRKVNSGAGVGRLDKDHLLKALVKKITPMIRSWSSQICYDFKDPVNIIDVVNTLKKKQGIRDDRRTKTFKQFFLSHFPFSLYQRFCWSNGYTDFEQADVMDTLYDYGFDDNRPGSRFFYVPWNKLILFLKSSLKKTDIRRRREMVSYDFDESMNAWYVCAKSPNMTNKGSRKDSPKHFCFYGKKVVLAGFLDRQLSYNELNNQIGKNPFLRAYSYAKKGWTRPEACGMTFRKDKFQKTIDISRHVQMTAYADNRHAKESKSFFETTRSVLYEHTKVFYWPNGTHFYRPLDKKWKSRDEFIRHAQNPRPGLYVVGELVSRNQGWTEGALESVEKILPKLIR